MATFRKFLILVCVAGTLLAQCVSSDADAFRFIALGDAPYGDPAEVFPPYKALIANVNKHGPALVIHVGDTHGVQTCANDRIDELRGFMNDFSAPVLYTPGDNEWTDCARAEAGPMDPLGRLDYIRKSHFQTGMTLGSQPVAVENQARAGYPENARLMMENVGFITVHVVGSNNNFRPDDLNAVKEFMARNAANVDWLVDSFAALSEADAIVVALHADMFRPLSGFDKGWHSMSPFREVGVTLGQQSSAFEKPVLLLYGDSHEFKSFQPFPDHRPFLHAIEVYGFPDIKAIEIAVRPDARKPFKVTQVFEP